MNRFFTTLTVFIVSFNVLQAQEVYVITNKDFMPTNSQRRTIQLYKGEIYPANQTTDNKGVKYQFKVDTSEFIGRNDVDKLTAKPTDRSSEKNKFVKIVKKNEAQPNDLIHIDLSSLSDITDTVWFAPETGKRTPFLNQKEANIPVANTEKKFRLIIPNIITIWYNRDELTAFTPPPPAPLDRDKNDGVPDNEDECPNELGTNRGCPDQPSKPKRDWGLIIIIGGVILGIGGGIGIGIGRLLLYRKKIKKPRITQEVPVTARYSSTKSLSEFAKENHVKFKDLLEWNNIKDSTNKAEQNKIKVELNGHDLIIGYKTKNVKQSSEPHPTNNNGVTTPPVPRKDVTVNDDLKNVTVNDDLKNVTVNDDLKNVIQDTIRQEIKPLMDILAKNDEKFELSKKIEELTKSGAEAKSRISKLENEKSESEKNVKGLQSEKSESEKNVKKLEDEKSDLEQEIGTLNDKVKVFSTIEDKVITVDFLKDYANEVYEYLKICGTVVDDAFKCYDSFNQQAIATVYLLTNYQTAVCSLPVGKWMQIVSEIKNKGIVVSDERLKQSLSTPVNEEEKQKEFQRTLFSEVLVKYSSNVLILAEAFGNLSRFPLVPDSVIMIENTFKTHFEKIINYAKSAGIEIKQAHLFQNIDEFRDIEAISGNRKLPYAEIEGLRKDDIAEIVSYGVKTQFEDTKTQIILT